MSGSRSGAGPGLTRSTSIQLVERDSEMCMSLPPGTEEIVQGEDLEEVLEKLADLCGAEVDHGR